MSYQVLARKWRPQTFAEVVGQEHVTRTLQNAVASGRVAHAFLFSGPRGVGKTSVARILAKALNCRQGPTPVPCNACQSCLEITQGSSMDVLEIDGASNRGIDEVRELRESIKYLPAHGGYRVFIIDEVHMLTKEAFNALLKTLEEPPAHAVFVLATTEPHKVPVTILSRCQRYDFRRLPTAVVQQQLAKICAAEGWDLPEAGLQLLAQEAEGGLRDALGLLDQVITFGGPRVSAGEIARILGVTERQVLLATLEAILQRQGLKLLQLIGELQEKGHDLRRYYQDLLYFARHLLLAALGPEGRDLTELADQDWERLQQLARQSSLPHLLNLLQTLLKSEEELRRSPLPRLALEIILLRLVSLEPVLALEDWLARLTTLEGRLLSQPGREQPPAEPLPTPGEQRAPATGSQEQPALEARWEEFLHFLEQDTDLWSKLQKSRLLEQRDGRLLVAPGPAWRRAREAELERVQELARRFFGDGSQVEFAPLPPLVAVVQEDSSRQLSFAEFKQKAQEILGGTWVVKAPPAPSEGDKQ